MKLGNHIIGGESPALGMKALYDFNSLSGKIIDYLPYKSTSQGIRLIAEKGIVAVSHYFFKMSRTGKFMTEY